MKTWIALLASTLVLPVHASNHTADSEKKTPLQVETIAQFDGIPWGVVLLDNKTAIVAIKNGAAYRVNLATGMTTRLTGLPKVDNRGQGGLLDVAVPPIDNTQNWLYFTYSKPTNEGATTALGRAKLDNNHLSDWQDLLVTNAVVSGTKHYGSRITFDNKGHVFFSIGDRGERGLAQDLSNHAGSIVRLHLDGRVPSDNPFVSDANSRNEIWSYGHRNPQGIYYDAKTDTLWSNEHGPRGGDEINLIRAGGNYGWPIVSYGKEYWGPSIGDGTEKEGIENPEVVFTPSIAPGSLLRYQSSNASDWNGDFISPALALRHLNRVSISQDGEYTETRYLEDLNERLRSIAQDDTGVLYIGTDSGKLLKVTLNGS